MWAGLDGRRIAEDLLVGVGNLLFEVVQHQGYVASTDTAGGIQGIGELVSLRDDDASLLDLGVTDGDLFWSLRGLDGQATIAIGSEVDLLAGVVHLGGAVANTLDHQPTFVVGDIDEHASLDSFDDLVDLGVFADEGYRVNAIHGEPTTAEEVLLLGQEQLTTI